MRPAVEAGAAHLALLDHGDVQPGRRGVKRRAVPARATADDHEVERRCGRVHGKLLVGLGAVVGGRGGAVNGLGKR